MSGRPSGTPNAPVGTAKQQVRARQPLLTAVQLTAPYRATLPTGAPAHGQPGDWLITRGGLVVDLVPASLFADRYETVVEGVQTLAPDTRTVLEQTLGIGATRSPAELVKAVERLAKIEIGGVRIDFTPGQLEEIAHRAKKRGRTVQQELQAVVDRLREDLFWGH